MNYIPMSDRWRESTWATFGDSITQENGYQPLVQQALQLKDVRNYGKAGCPMTAGGATDEGSTCHVIKNTTEGCDIMTIFAGTNDFRLNKPLGELHSIGSDYDLFTFTGAYQATVEHLLSHFPLSRLNLWTPLQRDKDGYDIYSMNEAGFRLEHYVEQIRDIGKLYSLPVLDLYTTSGINKLTLDTFTSDRLHPNEAGYRRIGGIAASFMMGL
ncbi:SGNH/GDSL hydrolase family protein [Paenibacillus sp. HB172176]|uniref:SGNH/GDSL hydrolase family protein n=1 Tax=Paenibacillus sp. HB172176 TaxID=2493690 RepID=UPI00143C66A2|nr:SGNH/GDSL hydrolase family protein [Paenibacillus sp. HB172176]